jgi:hypothetical protein
MKRIPLTLLLSLCFVYSAYAQVQFPLNYAKYEKSITPEFLKKRIYTLASPYMQGRETGEIGQHRAAEYVAKAFKKMGLKALDQNETYYQNFSLKKYTWGNSYLILHGDTLRFMKDIYSTGEFHFDAFQKFELVYLDSLALASNPNIKHKMVCFKNTYADSITNKLIKTLYQQGAALVIKVNDLDAVSFKTKIMRTRAARRGYVSDLDYLLDSIPVLEVCQAQLFKQGFATTNFTLPIAIQTKYVYSIKHTQNVLGYIPGKSNRYVVVSAHYDHLGMTSPDQIYYGADDNGTGTSAILAMAQAFSKAQQNKEVFENGILFIAFAGEEKGLLGSQYYTDHPLIPLANTISDLNIDMIGRIDEAHAKDSNYVYLIGSDKISQELHVLSEACNTATMHLSLDYTYNDVNHPDRLYYRSDHYNFAKHGIPSIFYFSGLHDDYHQITDTPDKILFQKCSKITKLVFGTAWQLRQLNHSLK